MAVELKRRRGYIADRWEARLTAAGIMAIAAIVIVLALVGIFDLLRRIFTGA